MIICLGVTYKKMLKSKFYIIKRKKKNAEQLRKNEEGKKDNSSPCCIVKAVNIHFIAIQFYY
jgi:hypothetical protein